MQTLVHLKAYKIVEFHGWSVHPVRKKSFSLISEFSALNSGFGHIISKSHYEFKKSSFPSLSS